MLTWLATLICLKASIAITRSEELPVAVCLAEGSKFSRPTISTINDTFLSLLTSGNLFVDKTLFIKHLIDSDYRVNLIAAPSKFGKSIGLHMVKTFFQTIADTEGNLVPREKTANYKFFTHGKVVVNYVLLTLKNALFISKYKDIMDEHQGKYPVIHLSLSSVTTKDFVTFFDSMKSAVSRTFKEHDYLLKVLERRRKGGEENDELNYHKFLRILKAQRDVTTGDIVTSLRFLSGLLKNHFNVSTIMLMDEYDLPFNKIIVDDSCSNKKERIKDLLVDFFDCLFTKNEDNFKMAVLMGTMKLEEGLIFLNMSGISNVHAFVDGNFSSFFGFNEMEVQKIIDACKVPPKLLKECHTHYKGYNVHGRSLFNPFAVARFVAEQKPINEWHAPNYVDTLITKSLWYIPFQNMLLNLAYGDVMEVDLQNLLFTKRDRLHIATALANRKSIYNSKMKNEENIAALKILFCGGYLTEISSENGVGKFACPTDEVKMTLRKRLLRYYQGVPLNRLTPMELQRLNVIKARLNKDHKVFQNLDETHFAKNLTKDVRKEFENLVRMHSRIISNILPPDSSTLTNSTIYERFQ